MPLLRRSPSFRTFAAGAKSGPRRTGGVRTKRPMVLANDPIEGSKACLASEVGFSVNDLAIAGEEHVAAHVMQRPR